MDDVTKQSALSSAEIAGPATADQAERAPPKPAAGRADNVTGGIVMMVLATIVFAAASAASKWLVAEYPVGEVLFLRSLASLIGGAAVILPVTGFSVYATRRPRDHLARGLSQSISQFALLLAFSLMPLWGDVPSVSLLIGSGIVVATGLFLFLREAWLQQSLFPARAR
jgi:hypothetical protein